jgi:hypothetical protein
VYNGACSPDRDNQGHIRLRTNVWGMITEKIVRKFTRPGATWQITHLRAHSFIFGILAADSLHPK